MKPYESDLSRIRALYRIPTVPGSGRTLELCLAGDDPILDADWPSVERAMCVLAPDAEGNAPVTSSSAGAGTRRVLVDQPLPYPAGSFDLIVLHRVLDRLGIAAKRSGVRFEQRVFLQQLSALLSPRGLVAGCVDNGSIVRLIHRWVRSLRHEASDPPSARFTFRSCARLLRQAGLTNIRIHSVLPNAGSPLKIVELRRGVVRFAFGGELESRRHDLNALDYWLRRLLLELGMYPMLEQSICFWGSKPC